MFRVHEAFLRIPSLMLRLWSWCLGFAFMCPSTDAENYYTFRALQWILSSKYWCYGANESSHQHLLKQLSDQLPKPDKPITLLWSYAYHLIATYLLLLSPVLLSADLLSYQLCVNAFLPFSPQPPRVPCLEVCINAQEGFLPPCSILHNPSINEFQESIWHGGNQRTRFKF